MAERYKHRLQPCPSYDVEGMEAWLEDMAAEGLLLIRDGFFLGFGEFAVQKPDHKVRYRLVARQKGGGFLSDGTVPDDKALELSEDFGWEFVTHRGDFYIYRTTRDDAREMDTDPEVQALAMNAVKKRQRSNVITLIIWSIIYPALMVRFGFVGAMLALGTPLFLSAAALIIWSVAEHIREFIHIRRLYRKLKAGERLERKKDWRQNAVRHAALNFFRHIATAVCIVAVFIAPLADALSDDTAEMHDYVRSSGMPFATAADFAAELDLRYDNADDYKWSYQIVEESDLLAPTIITWDENGDDLAENVSYYVEYFEMRTDWLAQLLAREMCLYDRWENGATPLEAPALDADFVRVYDLEYGPETAVIVVGSRVVRAWLRDYGYTVKDIIPLAEWTQILADSLK